MKKAQAKSKVPARAAHTRSKTASAAAKVRAGKRPTAVHHVVIHHAKRILGMTPKFVHGMVVGAFVGVLLVSVLRNSSAAHALSMNVSRDCTTNAVIHCGALTTDELKSRYANPGVASIYTYFGISATDIKNIGSTAVAGVAYKDGTIKLSSTGKTIATNALTAGRENISGSTKIVKDDVTFYIRRPSVSFIPDSLPVYVALTDGQFDFAIIPDCGNPIKAVAVAQPKPKPTPTPKPAPPNTPTPTPPTVTQIPTTPTPTPVTTASAVKTLPNTGPGAVVIIAILSVIGGYAFHTTHRHIRNKRQRHHTHPHAA